MKLSTSKPRRKRQESTVNADIKAVAIALGYVEYKLPRKPKGFKPSILNGIVARDLADFERKAASATGIFYRMNTGAVVSEYKGRKSFTRFCIPGHSDWVFWKRGRGVSIIAPGLAGNNPDRHIFIEAKDADGEQSPSQAMFQRLSTLFGFEYHLVRSGEEVKKILQ